MQQHEKEFRYRKLGQTFTRKVKNFVWDDSEEGGLTRRMLISLDGLRDSRQEVFVGFRKIGMVLGGFLEG